MDIVRIKPSFGRFDELLALIRSSFAYMDGVIDPPSSAHRLTSETLMQKAKDEIAFVAFDGEDLLGCIFCKPEVTSLYVGKLAVSPTAQGQGVGRALLAKAEDIASSLGLTALRLETRIELAGNHQRFSAWGFTKTAENSHPGYDIITSIEMTKRLG
ncbi:GNAT family N-acetyltransferase [Agrobacterium rosae]|uniref:GNAT family N-acetyltransferase n=1 Tax=Agrobacterium rosae TaxID=1972867 RepID=A0AAE5VR98_9HYPH|nr:GNAT family N-acetyltransferase [Agrobacterium rosae]KAA3511136.1 N-acetyltransferase [Agrobacterium rosae]KAA3518174.1 N-acetyltransferase [Agrobacterium rosae]MCM2434483.1 GNAT family N-acetyltransferase [Agrobacterium rosae]MDX8329249.1 GNAT family N-acetyltransferase [Agrobacterium rosae]MQB49765.1 N-acetyltransferase [Agrobacterium rosae]